LEGMNVYGSDEVIRRTDQIVAKYTRGCTLTQPWWLLCDIHPQYERADPR